MGTGAGDKVGAYEILGLLGAGAMGEVFRARDARLGREVAIKVLPAALREDAGRLRRFEQEARATGALNHPNVLAVYDVGEHDGAPYLVTELLEGQTLRERLADGPVPWRKALDWGRQVAAGLAAAHDKGIVHRDLKPENLFVTKDGRVKILDFGLAKEISGAGSPADPTLTSTEPGAVLGTAGYMAPEQVRGRPADTRSDIFAFGAVLHELLSGQRAFDGETPVERGYAILNHEPTALGEAGVVVPAGVERVVRRCLDKAPDERFQSARDLGFALEALAEGSSGTARTAAQVAAPVRLRPVRPLALTLGAVALVGLGATAATLRYRTPLPLVASANASAAAPVAAAEVRYARVTYRSGLLDAARFAEGGRSVVFSGGFVTEPPQIFLATPGRPETRAVSPPWSKLEAISPQDEMLLALVPEGPTLSLHYARAPLAGGAPREVLDQYSCDNCADLGPDGGLLVVREAQGKARLDYPIGTTRLELEGEIVWPRVSPAGDHIAFIHWPLAGDDRGSVELLDLRTGEHRTLAGPFQSAQGLAWRHDGAEVWYTAGVMGPARGVRAVTLDGRDRAVLAAPGTLTLNDLAPDGRALLMRADVRHRIAASVASAARETDLSWFDGSYPVDLTADGRWLLFDEGNEASGREVKVYVRRTDGSPPIALGDGLPLALSPDGKWALVSPRAPFDRLTLVPTGAGEAKPLPPGAFTEASWGAFFADGKRILIQGRTPAGWRLWVQDLANGAPEPVGPEGIDYATPPSPDGTRVVVVKDGAALLVRFDGTAPQALPHLRRDDQPLQWTADGRGLYLRRQQPRRPWPEAEVVVQDLGTGGERPWRVLVPPDPVGVELLSMSLIVTPDGKSYAYGYSARSSWILYVVDGLR